MALVVSSSTPLLLLNEQLIVEAASQSFCRSFSIDQATIVGSELFALGNGEWDIPQLRSLLKAIVSGAAPIDGYEIALKRGTDAPRSLLLNAHLLDHRANDPLRLAMAVTDISASLQLERDRDALLRDKQVLMQELNHRVANSLQIIASVLMQRVRKVQSEEARTHLRDAHNRVMSIATLQRQLAATSSADVALRPYLSDLCASISASMVFDPELVSLVVEVDDSTTAADRSTSIGLIVTELVINALKHAFPDPDQGGCVTVGFHTSGDSWTLTVADDGVGITDDKVSSEPGLGTGIVKALAGQLAAEIAVTSGHPGTIVTLSHSDAA